MTVILAIDPGPVQSAWVVFDTRYGEIRSFAISPNEELRAQMLDLSSEVNVCAIEQVRSYGMAVGAEVFDTVWWAGRFAEIATRLSVKVEQITRLQVKQALCHDSRAKDANIRAALIDRFGGPSSTKKGRQLYKVSKDVWAALGVALTYADQEAER